MSENSGMLDDLVKTIKSQLYERVSSPLLMAFILSWCVWNWKIFLIFVGDADLIEKLHFSEEYFPTFTWTWAWRCILMPLAMAFAYIFIYPLIAKPIFERTQKNQADLLKIRQKYEEEKPLPQKDARELRLAVSRAAVESDSIIARKDAQIQALSSQITALEQSLEAARLTPPIVPQPETTTNPLKPSVPLLQEYSTLVRPTGKSVSAPKSSLNTSHIEVLKNLLTIEDQGGIALFGEFLGYIKTLSRSETIDAINDLQDSKLIAVPPNTERVVLTAKGRKLALSLRRNEWDLTAFNDSEDYLLDANLHG